MRSRPSPSSGTSRPNTQVKFGVIPPLRSSREVVKLAQVAEDAGFWCFGVPDSRPRLWQGCYPTITASLLATERIRVAPQISNPVNHHWSVHAAAARALEELAPGRFMLGLATGDGALLSVGLRMARWAEMEAAVASLRELAPPNLNIFVAASGPKGAASAGRIATDLELAVGLDVGTLQRFAARARAARQDAGVTEPMRVWAMVPTLVVDEEDLEDARLEARVSANSSASFANSLEDKGIPAEWEPVIRERLARELRTGPGYKGPEERRRTALLFEDRPDIQDYLIDRMVIVGTAEDVRNKLVKTAREAGLDGIWISMMTSPFSEDSQRALDRLGAALEPELRKNADELPTAVPLQ